MNSTEVVERDEFEARVCAVSDLVRRKLSSTGLGAAPPSVAESVEEDGDHQYHCNWDFDTKWGNKK